MLTKESSRGFSPADSYPTYEYRSKSGRGLTANCDGSRIIPAPKGYVEAIRYHNEDEQFADYVKMITDEYKDIPDEKFKEHPYGIFIGRWRNARWMDEATRRGIGVPKVK